jgi:hypothetical protein
MGYAAMVERGNVINNVDGREINKVEVEETKVQ